MWVHDGGVLVQLVRLCGHTTTGNIDRHPLYWLLHCMQALLHV